MHCTGLGLIHGSSMYPVFTVRASERGELERWTYSGRPTGCPRQAIALRTLQCAGRRPTRIRARL